MHFAFGSKAFMFSTGKYLLVEFQYTSETSCFRNSEAKASLQPGCINVSCLPKCSAAQFVLAAFRNLHNFLDVQLSGTRSFSLLTMTDALKCPIEVASIGSLEPNTVLNLTLEISKPT